MSTTYRLLSLADLHALTVPDLAWIVDDICPRGASGLLTAREKAGKGLIVIDLMASVTNEETFLDRGVTACRAAYFAAEESIREVRDRVKARMGEDRDAPFFVVPLNTILEEGTEPERLKLDDSQALQRLANTIRDNDLGLIVLDTLRELHDLPENDSDYMGPLLRPLRQIAHDLNTTILINHHHSRNNTSRGSTAIKAAVDFEWSFVRSDETDEEGPPAGKLVVEGRWPKRVMHIQFGDGARWRVAAAPSSTEVDDSVRDHILKWLKSCQQWQTADDIAKTLIEPSYKLKTIQNTLSLMAKEHPCPVAIRRAPGRGGPKEYHTPTPSFDRPEDDSQPSRMNGRERSAECVELSLPPGAVKGFGREGKFADAEWVGADRWTR